MNIRNAKHFKRYAASTKDAAIQSACDDFPEFVSVSKSSPNDGHDFTLYDANGKMTGFLTVVTKAAVRKGWAVEAGSHLAVF
jgi:hypothetical protein